MPNILLSLTPNPWPLMWMRVLSPQVLEFGVRMDGAFRGRAYFDLYAQLPLTSHRAYALMTLDQF